MTTLDRFVEAYDKRVVEGGDISELMTLFRSASPETKDAISRVNLLEKRGRYTTLIHHLSAYGSSYELCELEPYCSNINTRTQPSGLTPLSIAVSRRNKDSVLCLLKMGADVNMTTANGDAPIHIAAMHKIDTVFTTLLKFDPDLNLETTYLGNKMTAHDMIAISSQTIVQCAVKHLLKKGLMTDSIAGKYLTPLVVSKDYRAIKTLFGLGLYSELDASPGAKAYAILATYGVKFDELSTFNADSTLHHADDVDVIAVHCATNLNAGSWNLHSIIERSHCIIDAIELLCALNVKISHEHYKQYSYSVKHLKANLQREPGQEAVAKLRDLENVEEFFEMKIDRSMSLYDMVAMKIRALEIKERFDLLVERVNKAKEMVNWKLCFQPKE